MNNLHQQKITYMLGPSDERMGKVDSLTDFVAARHPKDKNKSRRFYRTD